MISSEVNPQNNGVIGLELADTDKPKEINEQGKIDEIINNDIDKDLFFSVGVARKKTNAVIKKRIEVSMFPIYDKINVAINNGQYMIECVLTSDQKSFLVKRNFWVTGISTVNGKTLYKIRWD